MKIIFVWKLYEIQEIKGRMERWNNGKMGRNEINRGHKFIFDIPIFQHSIIPVFQHSNIPK